MSVKTLASSGVLFTERREFDLPRSMVNQLAKNVAPFTKWLDMLPMKEVMDPDFKMFEEDSDFLQEKFYVDGSPSSWSSSGAPGGTVTADVDGAVNVSIDDSLIGVMVEIYDSTKTTLKGMALVDSVTDSNTVVFSALGNPTVANQAMTDLADDDILYVNGHAWGEGKTSPDAFHNDLGVVYNSAAISRTSLELTNTIVKAALLPSAGKKHPEIRRIRDRKSQEHVVRLERKYLTSWRVNGIGGVAHGAGGDTDSTFEGHTNDKDGNKVRTTAGFIPIMLRYGRTSGDKQNVFEFSKASKKYSDTVEVFEKASQYGYDIEMDAFCGPGAISYFNNMNDSQRQGFGLRLFPAERSTEGFVINRLQTNWGILRLIPLKSLFGGPYHNWILIPNKEHIQRVQFRKDQFKGNIKTDDGYDGVKDEYFSDDGIKLSQVDGHIIIKLK